MTTKTIIQRISDHKNLPASERITPKYSCTIKHFQQLATILIKSNQTPSADQYEALFRLMRWEGQCGADKKKESVELAFGPKIAESIPDNDYTNTGIVGGGMGSIKGHLRTGSSRDRLWTLLKTVYTASDRETADNELRLYSVSPIKGVKTGTVSSFLWALKPEWYPIVNGGSTGGMVKCIHGFTNTRDLDTYVDHDIPCLEAFRKQYRLSNFAEMDRFFYKLGDDDSRHVDSASRFTFDLPELSTLASVTSQEGKEATMTVRTRKRSATLRRYVLATRGRTCEICGFDFKKVYGVDYAEVHHRIHIAKGKRWTKPEDLLVVCRNCHAMLHHPEFDGNEKKLIGVLTAKH